jgi:hypothetical protein
MRTMGCVLGAFFLIAPIVLAIIGAVMIALDD